MRTHTDADRPTPIGREPELRAAETLDGGCGAALRSRRDRAERAGRRPRGPGRPGRGPRAALHAVGGGGALPYVGLVDLFADLPEQRLDELLDGLAQGQREALRCALLRGRRPDSDLDRLALRVGVLQVLRALARGRAAC